jgi:hypothetical protein
MIRVDMVICTASLLLKRWQSHHQISEFSKLTIGRSYRNSYILDHRELNLIGDFVAIATIGIPTYQSSCQSQGARLSPSEGDEDPICSVFVNV